MSLNGPLRDAAGNIHRSWTGPARILSLVPSLTELVCDLGLADQLVGRTGFCIHPRAIVRSLPKVGGTKDVNLDRVRTLAPTHLIVNIDENRKEQVEALADFIPHIIVTHPLVPADNLALYRLLGGIFGREAEAEALCRDFSTAWEQLGQSCGPLPRERVLYLIWRDPWMSVARDTYISAMLAAAGWDSLPASPETRYPIIDWQAPWLAEVDRVLLPSEPYAFTERHAQEVAALSGRAVLRVDGEMLSWYGSRAVAGLRYLADRRLENN